MKIVVFSNTDESEVLSKVERTVGRVLGEPRTYLLQMLGLCVKAQSTYSPVPPGDLVNSVSDAFETGVLQASKLDAVSTWNPGSDNPNDENLRSQFEEIARCLGGYVSPSTGAFWERFLVDFENATSWDDWQSKIVMSKCDAALIEIDGGLLRALELIAIAISNPNRCTAGRIGIVMNKSVTHKTKKRLATLRSLMLHFRVFVLEEDGKLPIVDQDKTELADWLGSLVPRVV